jgi:hypothetical protein
VSRNVPASDRDSSRWCTEVTCDFSIGAMVLNFFESVDRELAIVSMVFERFEKWPRLTFSLRRALSQADGVGEPWVHASMQS